MTSIAMTSYNRREGIGLPSDFAAPPDGHYCEFGGPKRFFERYRSSVPEPDVAGMSYDPAVRRVNLWLDLQKYEHAEECNPDEQRGRCIPNCPRGRKKMELMQHHDKTGRGQRGMRYRQRQAQGRGRRDEDESAEDEDGAQCYICNEYHSEPGNEMLLCDGCDDWGCHLQCADPPLAEPPDGEWYCMWCRLRDTPD